MADDIPPWMDIKFFEKIFENDSQKAKVVKFDAHSPLGPGDNYTSHILRVKVNYLKENSVGEKSVTLIVKWPIGVGIIGELSRNANFYDKEPEVYSEVLPFIYKSINQNLGPKGYLTPLKDVMVMQDLKEEGFVVTKGLKQLDYEHCEQVMKIIAKFHACSMICCKQSPHLTETIGKEKLWISDTIKVWVKEGAKIVLDLAKEIKGDQRFIDFLSSTLETIPEGVAKTNRPKQTGFNVLNHGDLWMSNIMFKYGNPGEILDIKLIDFQISKWATPAADLTYFIWTSGNEDVRQNRLTDLFQEYLTNFNRTLDEVPWSSHDRLTWQELYADLQTARVWALVMICLCLPLMISAPDDVVDFTNFTEKDFKSEKFKNSYRGKNYLSVFPAVIRNYSDFYLNH